MIVASDDPGWLRDPFVIRFLYINPDRLRNSLDPTTKFWMFNTTTGRWHDYIDWTWNPILGAYNESLQW